VTERLLSALAPGVDLVCLCNPNNPTGRLKEPALLHEIAEVCRNNGTLLLLDECFIEFTHGHSMLPRLAQFPNLLILRAFTKIYAMAGLRLGMLYCADNALLSRIAKFCPTWNVSGVAQIAGLAALNEQDWIAETQCMIKTERVFMAKSLSDLGFTVYDSDANFLLIRSETSLYEPLRARGILVRACANFPGLDSRYIRIGLKTRTENTVLLEALSEALA